MKFMNWALAAFLSLVSPLSLALPEAWSKTMEVAAARADLKALYEGLQSGHYNLYVHRTRQAYDAEYAAVRASIDAPLSRYDASLRFQQFVAYGNVAHARID